MTTTPEVAFHGADLLGELPLWNVNDCRLWWVDVSRAQLQAFDPSTGRHERFQLPGQHLGGWALRRSGGTVVALESGLHPFDPATGILGPVLTELIAPAQSQTHRPNEAKCDARGRLWIGTLDKARQPTGSLCSIGSDLKRGNVLGSIAIPNGLCFSPDGATLYFCDSERKQIWAFDFEVDEGRICNQRVFCDLSDQPGFPDGSAVDAEGCVWNAAFGAATIRRIDPKGRIDRVVGLPTRKVTSLAFGGADRRTLFVTTASAKLSPEILAAEPLAGALFAFEPGPSGLPEPRFAG